MGEKLNMICLSKLDNNEKLERVRVYTLIVSTYPLVYP